MTAAESVQSIMDALPSLPDTFTDDREGLDEALLARTEAVMKILDLLQNPSSGPESLPSDTLKALSALAIGCCRTRICSSSSTGYEKIIPVFIEDDDRSACVKLYDLCTEEIKNRNPMYIPDPVERTGPERGRLLFLMKQFCETRSAKASKEQLRGTGFNRLFGSRG